MVVNNIFCEILISDHLELKLILKQNIILSLISQTTI
jgi:hypothetical protein